MSHHNKITDNFIFKNMPHKSEWPDFINTNNTNINCVTSLLDNAIAEGYGDKMAICSLNETWSYQKLLNQVNQIANVLVDDFNLTPGTRVILRSANTPMLAACWLAVIKAGGIAVTTIAMLRANEISTIASQSDSSLVLCDVRLKKDLKITQSTLINLKALYFNTNSLDTFGLEARMASKPTSFINYEPENDSIALIGFTSGTTGKPKGAIHSHNAVIAVCETFSANVVKATSKDIFSGTPPLGFVYGLGGLLLFPLYARASVVLLESPTPQTFVDAIAEFKISILFTAPTAYKALLEYFDNEKDKVKLESLKKCFSAGEALSTYVTEDWLSKAGIRLMDGIGSTELLHIFLSVQNKTDPIGSLGKPVLGYEACVLNDHGEKLGINQVGLLAVRGPTGCRYINDKRQQDYVRNGWNVTGDTAKIDENGYFWYQARTDGMIISSGYNIAAPDVEATISRHPSVKECAVIGIPNTARGQIIRAYIVLNESFTSSDNLIKEIQVFSKQQASPYKYPRSIKFIEKLPRTLSGKIQHFVLKEMVKQE
ncbi:MAG: 2-aminobenzoate-CoA ligase [Paraglaciecola sp.]|jgi:2-aminobenzoate-CoA ligase